MVAIQAQIQALLIATKVGIMGGFNIGSGIEVIKPLVFSREVEKVEGFITACKLCLKLKMREITIEEQIQWILLYVQEKLANVWKENLLEDLESKEVEFKLAGEFLLELKKEFGREDKELIKVVELKRIEQEGRTIEKFVQKFRRAVRGSRYQKRALVEEFKKGMSGRIRRKLMETENPSFSIEQQYKHTPNLDCYWRENRKDKKRLRERRERRERENQGQKQQRRSNQEGKLQLLLPQVWFRRQEISQQRITLGPALMERIKRTNVMMVRNLIQGSRRRKDPIVMDVDRGINYYSCEGFGYLAQNCRK